MKKNLLYAWKVLFLGLVFFVGTAVFAQQTSNSPTSLSTKESMPIYSVLKSQIGELPNLVDRYGDQVKVCKRYSDDLESAINISTTTGVLVAKAQALDTCDHLASLILYRFSEICVDIFRVKHSPTESVRFGWTMNQLSEANHWYDKMIDSLEKINKAQVKYVSPDEMENLLDRAAALCNARLVFYTPVFFI